MIPETYWRILLRWPWLILSTAITFGAVAYWFTQSDYFTPRASYNSTVSLGVSRVLDVSGNVTPEVGRPRDVDAVNKYIWSLIQWAEGPQFQARLATVANAGGLQITQADIARDVSVGTDPGPVRANPDEVTRPIIAEGIRISATASDSAAASLLAGEAANVLRRKAADDERQLRDYLTQNYTRARSDLVARLNETNTRLLQAPNGPDAPALRATVDVLQGQIAAITAALERLNVNLLAWEEPLVVSRNLETASRPAQLLLRGRDLVGVAVLAGLVAGWFLAGLGERVRLARELGERGRPATEIAGERV